ncbi:hypothetical protein BKA70DRAFT_611157 [Coprinopsis sp. MPI-PUGE-AT-0042]|nr:hypothetical protein BKA70DRAFT_611157 [Coprinopsis sp. MPI-PUGE-AT-0042]
MYPYINDDTVVGADAAGVVIASSDPQDTLLNQRVFLTPNRGWKDDPEGPEGQHIILGGSAMEPSGTFSEYIVLEREHVIPTPEHLDDVHAAAWPLGAVTAWRATMVNAAVKPGHNVLITGIGGGVALLALQFCVALGASVYVTSGNPEKIKKAVELGAKGGVNYKEDDWAKKAHERLQEEKPGASFNSVIDSSGNEILSSVWKYLKQGGRVVMYGGTAGPKVTMTMEQVVMNQRLLGSTMGSEKDLRDATKFVKSTRLYLSCLMSLRASTMQTRVTIYSIFASSLAKLLSSSNH